MSRPLGTVTLYGHPGETPTWNIGDCDWGGTAFGANRQPLLRFLDENGNRVEMYPIGERGHMLTVVVPQPAKVTTGPVVARK